MSPSTTYTDRIDRVTNYLREHLDESPSLDDLADVAHFSPYHFHRIFTTVTGETVNQFTNRLRLEKAARLLRYSKDSLTDIAFDCGFSSSSTFSRGFRQYFGISPREYRNGVEIENSKIRKELFPMAEYLIPMSGEELRENFPVEIRRFPERRVAFIRVIGGYEEERVPNAYRALMDWARSNGLWEQATVFGMSLDDPMVTPREKYRYEACLTVPDDTPRELDSEISLMTMPEMDYAVTSVSGDLKRMATATNYLFSTWLVESEYEPEHSPGIEIFLDKENVLNWERFDLELCLPVKPNQKGHR
ncbi:MAG: AraC family transcriptional regulator [Acidobacteria bacterium]|nr:MAG: AraC family transcriptional regulator [Acidobacteriota bacterium]REK02984.1 MAG: AraC family transcriptional regulator [Acidobacteriota bacterium]REK13212.1 MAG: AraC family transcriptional regulator [Acidobacteriota bacterium]REK41206.1 MAG: AraC family transcriptional regulator [Acidobacteriota bacterium]